MQKTLALVLTIFSIGTQCQDYHYDKPLVPFQTGEGSKHQFLTTSTRMIIPGANGYNYEVSMYPANDIFHMHLERQQYQNGQQSVLQNPFVPNQGSSMLAAPIYAVGQGSISQGVYTQAPQQAALNNGYGQVAPQLSVGHVAGLSPLHYQASSSPSHVPSLAQQHSGNHAQRYAQHSGNLAASTYQSYYQQAPANQIPSAPYNYQQNGGVNGASSAYHTQQNGGVNGASSAYHTQQFQPSFGSNNPVARFIRKCHPNGYCEDVANDQQHQQVQQQARSHFIPAPTNCHRQNALAEGQGYVQGPSQGQSQRQQNQGQGTTSARRGLRDRRLFPYSEVQIPAYPYNK